ncbi:unnamed protein product [Psylliodes chrysocephalus]|uniref:Peptidoglycan recognition protein family domain-containing protein n=1 Tax=Psylliodes chrysocephalus TaxID=3402493 RepID=A0A9P0D0J5_9CUCU|nr:unnamed protein product [Psylliodes chrysocephala]
MKLTRISKPTNPFEHSDSLSSVNTEADQQEQTEHKRRINYIKWSCFLIVAILGILTTVKLTLKNLQQDIQEIVEHHRNANFISIPEWGGVVVNRTRFKTNLYLPVPFVIIRHTGGAFCQTQSECKRLTKELQSKHLALNYSDIAYNFLVGGDGSIYMGRGFWNPNIYSRFSYDIAIHGNFLYDQFYDYMENVTRFIIETGVMFGAIDPCYVVLCENQTQKVDSPGRNIYEKVKLWDHYHIKADQQEQTEHKRRINYIKWVCFLIVATLGILTTVKLTFKNLQHDIQEIVEHHRNMNFFAIPDWGGVVVNTTGFKSNLYMPVPFVIIKHTGGTFCQTESECKQLTKELQSKHLALNYSDIAYNFLVGGDGNLYVGRGFGYPNIYSRFSYDIAIHGNFLYDQFYDYMENTTRYIIEIGVSLGAIDPYYVVLCENQTQKVDSPGRNIYEKVKLWDHYQNDCEETFKTILGYLKAFCHKRKKDLGRICICVLLSSCAILLYVSIVHHKDLVLDPKPLYGRNIGNFTIYYVSDWGGKTVTGILDNPLPVGLVIVGHTGTETCFSFEKCSEILRVLQIYQTTTLGYGDICDNFFIGGNGNIYVGRGWDTRNCYLSKLSIAISFIGDFNKVHLNEHMKTSFKLLLQQGINLSKLPENYLMVAYNQTVISNNPGDNVYKYIKTWPNFSDIDLRRYRFKDMCSIYKAPLGKSECWSRVNTTRIL